MPWTAETVAAMDLPAWLEHIEQVHPREVALGLDRLTRVARRLDVTEPAPTTIIVAGTNGKGSTCVALEHLLRASGRRVGTTLSPHLIRFNERVRLDGQAVEDALLCRAFQEIEAARGEVLLTYFEYSALAALLIFRQAAVEVAVLEVGLGGRLDAFNVVGADLAVVTSIGLDHQEYLGPDLESIGREKAGVFRPGQRVVLGRVSDSVHAAAAELDCAVLALDREIRIREAARRWSCHCEPLNLSLPELPRGSLAPANCALALTAVAWLSGGRPAGAAGLAEVSLPGRMERFRYRGREVVLDVAHNPAAARFLARALQQCHPARRYVAIVGMLEDKDAAGVAEALSPWVRAWLTIPTGGPRGRSARSLLAGLGRSGDARADAADALDAAVSLTGPGDGILVFGSFSAVEQARELLDDQTTAAR